MTHSQTAPIRVLVVEDHPVTRHGIRTSLHSTGTVEVIAEAADARTACELADRTHPDVALVDLTLAATPGTPTAQGIDVIHHLHTHLPDVRILVMSQAQPHDIVPAIRAGAHGWIAKSATTTELADAVTAIRTGPVLPPELAAHLVHQLHRGPAALTPRERDVLRCLAKGYDNREIAEELDITVRTVNRHLENIRGKVGHHRRSELIRLAKDTP